MENDEYTRRLPALVEARRLVIERYNLYSQVLQVVAEHEAAAAPEGPAGRIYNRHYLRRNPVNLMEECFNKLRVRRFVRSSTHL